MQVELVLALCRRILPTSCNTNKKFPVFSYTFLYFNRIDLKMERKYLKWLSAALFPYLYLILNPIRVGLFLPNVGWGGGGVTVPLFFILIVYPCWTVHGGVCSLCCISCIPSPLYIVFAFPLLLVFSLSLSVLYNLYNFFCEMTPFADKTCFRLRG